MSWLDVLGGAIGGLGWTEEQFWASDPRTLEAAHEARRRIESERYKAEWERVRWMTATVIAPHLKRPIAPVKLLEFDWERSTRRTTRREDYQGVADKLGRRIKK